MSGLRSEFRIDDHASKSFDAMASAIKSASREMEAYLELSERASRVRLPSPFQGAASARPSPTPAPVTTPVSNPAPTTDPIVAAIEQVSAGIRQLGPEAYASSDALKVLFERLDGLDSAADIQHVVSEIDAVYGALEGLDDVDSTEPVVVALEELRRSLNLAEDSAESLEDRFEDVRRAGRSAASDANRRFRAIGAPIRAAEAAERAREKAARAAEAAARRAEAANKRWRLSLKSIGEAYLGVQGLIFGAQRLSGVFEAADQRTMLRGRLAGLSEQQRGGYSVDTLDAALTQKASAVGYDKGAFAELSMGFMQGTSGAFGSMGEAVKFSELLAKQFHASGVGAEAASRAMDQLRQGLGKGALDTQDMKSVLESAPQIVELMAKELGVSSTEMRKLTSEGKVTSDVIKNAILNNAEQINASFEAMPVTWEQSINRMKNAFFEAADPILQRISEMASSESFQRLSRALLRFAVAFVRALDWILPKVVPIAEAFVFMAEAISNNIELAGTLALGLYGLIGLYSVIVNWKKIMIALDAMQKASNPYLLLATAVIAVAVALKHLWDTNVEFKYGVLGAVAVIGMRFKQTWSYIGQGFTVLVGGIIVGVGAILYAIQEMVNAAIYAYNKVVPGGDMAYLSFGDDVMSKGKGMLDAKPWDDERTAIEDEYKLYVRQLGREKDEAQKALELATKKEDEPIELAYGQSEGRPLHTKGNTKIDKDSIALLKDIASVEIVNRYTTVRPKISASFGDVHQTADVNGIMDVLSTRIVDGVGASLIAAGGYG